VRDELLLEDEVPLIDLSEVAADAAEDGVVVAVRGLDPSLKIGEELVVELDLAGVEGDLRLEPRREELLQEAP
jgi:hypothetical protein